jgi:hypothetical protein
LSTFLGTFLFSIVGIGLFVGYYDDRGRIILFFATIAVDSPPSPNADQLIQQPSTGRMNDLIERVELHVVLLVMATPYLNAQPPA